MRSIKLLNQPYFYFNKKLGIKRALTCPYINSNYKRYSSFSSKPPWKVMFFGNDNFSLVTLNKLNLELKNKSLISKLEVVTSSKSKQNPIYTYSIQQNLKIYEWYTKIVKNEYDVGIVVSFGHLIPEEIINSFPLGILNVHASLLPRWRGAAPIIHALKNGDTQTGITIMRIHSKKFDVGEILYQTAVDIPCDIMMPELSKQLADLGANLILKTMKKLPNVLNHLKPQPDIGITYAPRVSPQIANVNWHCMKAEEIYNLHRSIFGLYNLTTTWHGMPVKFYDCSLYNTLQTIENNKKSNNFNLPSDVSRPGYVRFHKNINKITIQCADNKCVVVGKIGIGGKKVMSARDFFNGFMSKIHPKSHVFR